MIFGNYITGLLNKYHAWKNRRFVQGVLNDNRAVFTSFGKDIYLSDIVNNCIDRIATEISKIDVRSVISVEDKIAIQNDDITRLFLFRPNELQTSKDFLSACVWLQRKTMHCFIYPVWTEVYDKFGRKYRKYTALWPLNPASAEIGRDGETGDWLIRFHWRDGSTDILPYKDVIHLKWRRGKNMIMGGGDDYGNPDTRDTLQAVDTLNKMMQGLPLSIDASLKLNGVFTSKTKLDADQLRKARDEFEDRILTSKTGIAAVDIAGEFTPITSKQVVVSKDTMEFIKDIIRNRYGVSAAILNGDYNDIQHASFYETCLEDFIVEFEQAATSCLFNDSEQGHGHRIKCYYNKVEYYDTANKMQLAQIGRDTGIMTLNQMAELFGLPPFEGGNRRIQSLNYANVDLIDNYQTNMSGTDKDTDSDKGKDNNDDDDDSSKEDENE